MFNLFVLLCYKMTMDLVIVKKPQNVETASLEPSVTKIQRMYC